MSRTARIVTMWTNDHKVHVKLSGDADADVVARLDRILARLLQVGATHLVVHLDRMTGDDTAVLELLVSTCQRLWIRWGIMETVGLRGGQAFVPSPRAAPESVDEARPTIANDDARPHVAQPAEIST